MSAMTYARDNTQGLLCITHINSTESYTTGLGGATTYISSVHEGACTYLSLFSEGKTKMRYFGGAFLRIQLQFKYFPHVHTVAHNEMLIHFT